MVLQSLLLALQLCNFLHQRGKRKLCINLTLLPELCQPAAECTALCVIILNFFPQHHALLLRKHSGKKFGLIRKSRCHQPAVISLSSFEQFLLVGIGIFRRNLTCRPLRCQLSHAFFTLRLCLCQRILKRLYLLLDRGRFRTEHIRIRRLIAQQRKKLLGDLIQFPFSFCRKLLLLFICGDRL